MNEDTQKPAAETPVQGPNSRGLCCPKCSKTDIQRHFGWGAFVISTVVAVFVTGDLDEAIKPPKEIQALFGDFGLQVLKDAIVTFLIVAVIWMFFSALVGKNRCKACGHRWK